MDFFLREVIDKYIQCLLPMSDKTTYSFAGFHYIFAVKSPYPYKID